MIKATAIPLTFLLAGSILIGSCNNEESTETSSITAQETGRAAADDHLLVGSWKDTSQAALHFTLFKDGTARSDNMETLLYKTWSVNGKQVTFTIESVGNGTSSTDTIIYTIEKLSADELILRRGTELSRYTRQ